MSLITLEEHFLSTAFIDTDAYSKLYGYHLPRRPEAAAKLKDLGDIRVGDMDAGDISVQVVSHAPGLRTVDECRGANDQLYAAILERPSRLAGFAVLPVDDPIASAEELKRCVKQLGFKGALIDNATGEGRHFTGKDYHVMWEAFCELDVPCYLHPTWPITWEDISRSVAPIDGVGVPAMQSIESSAWCWHSDVGVHILKLYGAGTFDRFPRLKLIIGHFGEMIPFMLDRIDNFSTQWSSDLQRRFSEVWNQNIWITTSGVWSVDPMATILRNTSIDRIMYSVDYPFANNETGKQWFELLRQTGWLTDEQLEQIAFRNAQKLLGLENSEKIDTHLSR